MPTVSLSQYTERQSRALLRIKEMMTASDLRAETQYKRIRRHDRKPFQGIVLICLPTLEVPEPSEDHPSTFQAWAYNISQGGVGFVLPTPIPAENVAVGLKFTGQQVRWMSGRIVRNRPIPEEEFIDYGVAFFRPEA